MTTKMEEHLQQEFPQATSAECKRFVAACRNDKKVAAMKLLQEYLDWRLLHQLDNDDINNDSMSGDAKPQDAVTTNKNSSSNNDADDWEYAVTKALRATSTTNKKTSEINTNKTKKDANFCRQTTTMDDTENKLESGPLQAAEKEGQQEQSSGLHLLPQWVFIHQSPDEENIDKPTIPNADQRQQTRTRQFLVDQNGKTILHILPARLDRCAGVSAATCALAVALYLDRKLDRHSEETMTIFIDTRPGRGWPNPLAPSMVTFIHKISKELESLYPERLEYLIVAPIPTMALYIWNAVKLFLRKSTRDKVILASGPAGMNSTLPKHSILPHVEDHVLMYLEKVRLDQFVPSHHNTGDATSTSTS